MTIDISFLLGSSALAVVLVQILKSVYGTMSARFGALICQMMLVVVAFVVAGIGAFFQFLPQNILSIAYDVFSGAVVVYEVLYKAIYQKAIMGRNLTNNQQ